MSRCPGVSGTTYHGGTGLSLDQESAAISPVWLEKPKRIAALAMLTVVGLLVYAVIQRQVRLYLRDHEQHVPGNKGPTATPTAAVVFAPCPGNAGAICCGEYNKPPGPWRPGPSSARRRGRGY